MSQQQLQQRFQQLVVSILSRTEYLDSPTTAGAHAKLGEPEPHAHQTRLLCLSVRTFALTLAEIAQRSQIYSCAGYVCTSEHPNSRTPIDDETRARPHQTRHLPKSVYISAEVTERRCAWLSPEMCDAMSVSSSMGSEVCTFAG